MCSTGIPDVTTRKRWARMNDTWGSADLCDPEERRIRYTKFLRRAHSVVVPSKSAQCIYNSEFPELLISVVPHPDHLPHTEPVPSPPPRDDLVIAVIGAIGHHKGSDVLTSLAAYACRNKINIKYHLIGYSNNDEILGSYGVSITGRYSSEESALQSIDTIQPDFIFLPSIGPRRFVTRCRLLSKNELPPRCI